MRYLLILGLIVCGCGTNAGGGAGGGSAGRSNPDPSAFDLITWDMRYACWWRDDPGIAAAITIHRAFRDEGMDSLEAQAQAYSGCVEWAVKFEDALGDCVECQAAVIDAVY